MAMTIQIRHSVPEDYRAMQQIFSHPKAVSGTLSLPFGSEDLWKKRLSNKPDNFYHLVACTEEGLLVGALGLVVETNPRRRHAADIGMAVRDDWQGKGVGSALMAACVELADQWLNLVRLELTVFTDNEAALKLYEKFGFKIEGTLEKYAFREGKFMDTYSMARVL